MPQFSLGNAWSKGVSFFSQYALNHAIILIGLGVLAPFVLQFLIMGNVMGMMNPAMMGQSGLQGLEVIAGMGTMVLIVMVVGYILQMGSYFGSWRQGFGDGEALPGAITYGLIAGVMIVVALFVVVLVGVLVSQATPLVGGLLLAILLLPLLAALYTVWAALIAVVLLLILLIALAFGASMTDMNAAFAQGGAIGILIFLALAAVLLWLSARFSCTAPIMADRRTFNLMTGLSESWRLTSASQFRIMGYLALLSIVLMVLFFIVAMIIGVGMAGSFQGGAVPEVGIGMIVGTLVVSIPLAYLTVLVPAGIYRELGGGETSARVFA